MECLRSCCCCFCPLLRHEHRVPSSSSSSMHSFSPLHRLHAPTLINLPVFRFPQRSSFISTVIPHHSWSFGLRSMAFSPRGGGRGYAQTIINLAGAGLLTYLTLTGKLSWLFDAIFSLWVFLAVSWWLAERFLLKGLCPNCGGEFQVFEFAMKEKPQLCPFCSQPFKLENGQFVREEPQFSKKRQGSRQPFESFQRGFKQSFGSFDKRPASSQKEKNNGVIVDIEAEVRDKD